LASADSAVVIPIDELVSPPEGIEPTIPPPSTDTTTIGARITIRQQTSISLPPEAEVERLLAMPTPPPSPLTLLLPPSAGERLARCMAPAALPSPPLPPSLYPPSLVDRRDDIPEKVGYGIRDTWIDPAEAVPDMASTTLEKVNTRVTELAELCEHDTQDLYALLEDAQDENQVKFATCTLLDASLTWWNGQIQTLGPEAYAMTWEVLKKKITNNGCAIENQVKFATCTLLDASLTWWNGQIQTLGQRKQCPNLHQPFLKIDPDMYQVRANENEKIDKYISGLLDNIYRNVKSSKPRMLDETIELTNDLMDQKLRTYAERGDNKRKTDDTSRNNHGYQQQPFKKQNVAKFYM
nr:hypothetical protein [Tanacetum cinerariifolium]